MQRIEPINNIGKSFHFKQFTVQGGSAGMPVSTDGVMLGAWADLSSAANLLDIGTGTGLLALMCAQRSGELDITAMDIDDDAFHTAEHNASQSPWSNRVHIQLGNILDYSPSQTFDAIICNPPYFNSGKASDNQSRAIARHTDTLNHDALLAQCQSLLSSHGKASFILPSVEGKAFIETAKATGWHLSRFCEVRPSIRKPPHRVLLELCLQKSNCQLTELTIHEKQGYSEDFIQLTQDFYLKM